MADRLSEGPYGGRQSQYREWMVERIEESTGTLYDIGNLSAGTLEKLYGAIVQKDPQEQYREEKKLGR